MGGGNGDGTGTLEGKISQGAGQQWKQVHRAGIAGSNDGLAPDKSGAMLTREEPIRGRMGGASSSSVEKTMRPQRTKKKGNTHSKSFMTWELWKACELATGQALLPKRGDFSDINEYNNCCREWKARGSLHLSGGRSSDVQILSRHEQRGETSRNLETHLAAEDNSQEPQIPSMLNVGNSDSKLTGASRPLLSSVPTGEGKEGNGVSNMVVMDDTKEEECESPAAERTGENMDRNRNQDVQSLARGSFDLNHTIHSKLGGKNLDDLGFSIAGQESNNGTARLLEGLTHQNHLPSHLIPVVREWLKSQGLKVQLPGSLLGPRLSKKSIEKKNGQEGSRPQWKEGGIPAVQGGGLAAIRPEEGSQSNAGI